MSKDYEHNYLGFTQFANYTFGDNAFAKSLFSDDTIDHISKLVTKYLDGVDPSGKKIVVTCRTISNALSSIFENYRPNTQDIYTRYNITKTTGLPMDDYNYIVYQTVDLIVNQIKLEIETAVQNSKLTVWTTVLGESNQHGLRAHDQIKIRKRKPPGMLFNMNY